MDSVKLIECPRDAWQGLPQLIPAAEKAAYLKSLIDAGFRTIDAVSFVSPEHVKQMADSEEVMSLLLESLPAASISAYFRRTNANMTRSESRRLVEQLKKATKDSGRGLVIYISMAFGNPYEEPWGPEIVEETLEWLKDLRVTTVSLADTVGTATPAQVGELFGRVKDHVAGIELGVHLHSRAETAAEKILAAYDAGCRRFDSAMTGLGGCPFAADELVGNIPTETLLDALSSRGVSTQPDRAAVTPLIAATNRLRAKYAYAQPVN